jgi:hypothetical protein
MAVTAAAAAPRAAVAQRASVGLLGGLNSAQLVSDDETSDRRNSWMFGAYAEVGLGGLFSLRPELLIAEKGGQESLGPIDLTAKLRWLQVPVLLRLDIATSGPVNPYFELGPAVSFRIGCELEGEFGGQSASADCDDLEALEIEADPVKKTDVSAIIGAGLRFGRWGLGVRYDHGLADLNDSGNAVPGSQLDDGDITSRTVTLYGSVRLGGRR